MRLRMELSDFMGTPLAKAIVLLRAVGLSSDEVRKEFGYSQEEQDFLMQEDDELAKLFDKYDITTRETETEKMLRLARSALALKQRILTDESQPMTLRNGIATEIYEQVYGKARQKIETVNYNIDAGDNIEQLKNGLQTIWCRLVDTAKKKGLVDDSFAGDAIEVE